jgi:hypothetical protein
VELICGFISDNIKHKLFRSEKATLAGLIKFLNDFDTWPAEIEDIWLHDGLKYGEKPA